VPRVKYPMEYRLKNSFSMGCASRKVIFPGIRLTERLRLLFLLLGPAFLEISPTTDPIISRILPSDIILAFALFLFDLHFRLPLFPALFGELRLQLLSPPKLIID